MILFDHFPVPAAFFQMKQQCSSGIRIIRPWRAAQQAADIILGQHRAYRFFKKFRLIFLYPQQRRQKYSCTDRISDARLKPAVFQHFDLLPAPLIRPDDHRAKRLFLFIQQNNPMHLPRYPNRPDPFFNRRFPDCPTNCLTDSSPQHLAFLFSIPGMRNCNIISRFSTAYDISSLIHHHRFRARCSHINS